jgi:hypothetical protein
MYVGYQTVFRRDAHCTRQHHSCHHVAVDNIRFEFFDNPSEGKSSGGELNEVTFLTKRVVLDPILLEEAHILSSIGANGDLQRLLELTG